MFSALCVALLAPSLADDAKESSPSDVAKNKQEPDSKKGAKGDAKNESKEGSSILDNFRIYTGVESSFDATEIKDRFLSSQNGVGVVGDSKAPTFGVIAGTHYTINPSYSVSLGGFLGYGQPVVLSGRAYIAESFGADLAGRYTFLESYSALLGVTYRRVSYTGRGHSLDYGQKRGDTTQKLNAIYPMLGASYRFGNSSVDLNYRIPLLFKSSLKDKTGEILIEHRSYLSISYKYYY